MRLPGLASISTAAFSLTALGACSSSSLSADAGPPDMTSTVDLAGPPAASKITHLVVVVQENHTFDNHFGAYCTAAPGSNPTCTEGHSCCEAAPQQEPGMGAAPTPLTDAEHAVWSPDHNESCELDEIDGGKMDRFVTSALCGSTHNFAVAPASLVMPYWQYAQQYAIADRYFQPIAGASSANDMYLARAAFVFANNDFGPGGVTKRCSVDGPAKSFMGPTIGDLLVGKGVSWAFYAEGYQAMVDSINMAQRCPDPPDDCPAHSPFYPCLFDASDVPFEYYDSFRDNPLYLKDYTQLTADLTAGRLPQVSFVKAIGYRTEHPGTGTTLSDGVAFVTSLVGAIEASAYAADTLVLVTYDEGGGYFDHVPPPPPSVVDNMPYGTRVPLMAIGPFARKNHVSHVVLEHSSIVKFIEWNWLDQMTGQLGTRDAVVNNLGSLLDPSTTGIAVPE